MTLPKKENLLDKRFGRLVVTSEAPHEKNSGVKWLCLCDCGNTKIVRACHLKANKIRSCGCLLKEETSKRNSIEPGVASFHSLLLSYRVRAKARGFEWQLTDDEAFKLFKQNCHYCGLPPKNKYANKSPTEFLFNGIDRVDNDKGYVSTNVVSCCKMCNRAKSNLPLADFLSWIDRTYKYLNREL